VPAVAHAAALGGGLVTGTAVPLLSVGWHAADADASRR